MGEHDDTPFPGDPEGPDKPDERGDQDRRRLFERVMPEILKRVVERAVESGASRLAEGPENLRNFVQEMKLPKEVLHYLYTQIDDTKNGLYRVVAKEIRDVLEQTHFADELTQVLTKLSFEIKTEIRFIPNDAGVKKPSEGADDDAPGDGSSARSATDSPLPRPPGPRPSGTGTGRAGGPQTPGKFPKPEVTAQVSIKDRGKDARR